MFLELENSASLYCHGLKRLTANISLPITCEAMLLTEPVPAVSAFMGSSYGLRDFAGLPGAAIKVDVQSLVPGNSSFWHAPEAAVLCDAVRQEIHKAYNIFRTEKSNIDGAAHFWADFAVHSIYSMRFEVAKKPNGFLTNLFRSNKKPDQVLHCRLYHIFATSLRFSTLCTLEDEVKTLPVLDAVQTSFEISLASTIKSLYASKPPEKSWEELFGIC